MVVQHNLRAMNSNRMLGLTANVQSKSTEKLSSGYKINRAADDAAGLSISEKMRKQIRGLSQASLNAQDGISAVQTAEGALNEVQDMLQRMNELAVKASNGTMSEDDRSYIQNEITQLETEIDRVAETTKFNETYLLKGVESTETVETPASLEVVYEADITGEKTLAWDGAGKTQLYATKEGKSVAITEQNYKDFFEVSEKTVVDSVTIDKEAKLYDKDGNVLSASAAKDILNEGGKVYSNTGTDAVLNTDYELTQKKAVEGVDYILNKAQGASITIDLTGIKAVASTRTVAGVDVQSATSAQNVYDTLIGNNTFNSSYTAKLDGNELTITKKLTDDKTTTAGDVATSTMVAATLFVGNLDDGPDNANGGGDDITLASKANAAVAGSIATVDLKNADTLYKAGDATTSTLADSAAMVAELAAGRSLYVSTTYYDAKDGHTVYDVNGNVMSAEEITAAHKLNTTGDASDDVRMFTTSPVAAEEGKDYTVETDSKTIISVKDGYSIYNVAADEDAKFGAQKTPLTEEGATGYGKYFKVQSDLLMDKDENLVTADKLGEYFDANGNYKGGLYKYNDTGAATEVAAEQIDDYVEWKKTEASTEEVTVAGALHFSLQVGADTTEQNKISIDIESMSAKSLGVDGLRVDGKDSKNADAAVDVIGEAIQRVSTQRSALGAVQNRLEHTIANLDNVVENTTAAESQIRDTDMATEMVKFSNNNILAQAGQAMLAQANQANQGVLSLLG